MEKRGAINIKHRYSKRINILLITSLILAIAIIGFGGLKDKENVELVGIVLTMAVTMAGFGLVAFQVAHASDELKKDFIETSIILVMSTLSNFLYLIYPKENVNILNFSLNFGEIGIFLFLWGFILLLIILIDRRFDILK